MDIKNSNSIKKIIKDFRKKEIIKDKRFFWDNFKRITQKMQKEFADRNFPLVKIKRKENGYTKIFLIKWFRQKIEVTVEIQLTIVKLVYKFTVDETKIKNEQRKYTFKQAIEKCRNLWSELYKYVVKLNKEDKAVAIYKITRYFSGG